MRVFEEFFMKARTCLGVVAIELFGCTEGQTDKWANKLVTALQKTCCRLYSSLHNYVVHQGQAAAAETIMFNPQWNRLKV